MSIESLWSRFFIIMVCDLVNIVIARNWLLVIGIQLSVISLGWRSARNKPAACSTKKDSLQIESRIMKHLL